MKQFLISLILSCFAVCGFAQEHLTFKGIPITGSMTSFCQKLKAKGFVQATNKPDRSFFKGTFTGKKVTVGVGATGNGRNVHSVVVLFDGSDDWKTLTSTYDYYKSLYTEKYGEPEVYTENNPATSDFNISKMAALQEGHVTWSSIFEVPGGTISLSIEKDSAAYKGVVTIFYLDEQGMEVDRQSELDEI